MKRTLDVLVSLFAVVVLSPVLAIVALAVLIDSGAPVLFRQTRIGLHGREFGMLKFRSMVRNADALGPYHTTDNDPRITRIGAFVRRTSLDELPQLWNVLAGDMTLVGPRPDVPAQRSLYTERQWTERCSVRPGITGLAQALVRSDAKEGERLALDLRYVRERNLWLDLKILWWTLGRLSGKGSN